MNNELILSRINYHRLKRGWSINELALQSGITQSTLSNYFRNRNIIPSVSTLQKLCETLEISLSELFQENEDDIHLSKEERIIITYYRKMDINSKKLFDTMIKTYMEAIE